MTSEHLIERLRSITQELIPLPGHGQTPLRHKRLMDVGREDLSLARLAEAHWDAIAILAEAGRTPEPGAIYGVWASEKPGMPVALHSGASGHTLSGSKMFCSGAGLIDRALMTVGAPQPLLVDLDLRANQLALQFDDSAWKTSAFAATHTSTVTFSGARMQEENIIGDPGWYLDRPGFWHGACGPAACWAGGAAGLLDYALQQSRHDAHTLAHLGAMHSSIWATQAYLDSAGRDIDLYPNDRVAGHIRALTVRHLIEQACTEILRRIPRAYGPHPLAMNDAVSTRYYELDLYLRQSHAERDLEALGEALRKNTATASA